MQLRQLLADDDAVSEVIGVILMVAITVILAAVIASLVLGIGDQAGNVAPQASFSSDYDASEGNVTITHDSGDALVTTEVYFRGSGFDTDGPGGNLDNQTWAGYQDIGNASASGESEGQTAVVAGDSAEIGADDDYELRVVWESSEGDSSDTLLEDDGPQA